jgi:ankyrin repeat protein
VAFLYGRLDCATYLLGQGAYVKGTVLSKWACRGYGPVHLAASSDNETILRLVLQQASTLNLVSPVDPLHIAAALSNVNSLKMIFSHMKSHPFERYRFKSDDSTVNCPIRRDLMTWEWSLTSKLKAMGQLGSGTALHIACHLGHTQAISLLLDEGADTEMLYSFGQTALHLAAGRNAAIIARLVSSGANINAQGSTWKWITPYHVTGQQLGVFKYIISYIEVSMKTSNLNLNYIIQRIEELPMYSRTITISYP